MNMTKMRVYIPNALEAIPLLAPVFLVGFSLSALLLLILNMFNTALVLGGGLLVGGLTSYLVFRRYNFAAKIKSKERNISNAVVVAGVIVWVLINAVFTFQHLQMNRDPATYANAGLWLINNESIEIPRDKLFRVPYADDRSPGMHFVRGEKDVLGNWFNLHTQGAHLLPAYLGLSGRAGGPSFLLHSAPIFGGTAILALYALIRSLMKPKWAVIGAAILAGSLPLIYFSRDTYTEPIAATFAMGGLAVLTLAIKQKTRSLGLWFVSGLLIAAGGMARIDAYMIIAPILLALFVFAYAVAGAERRKLFSGIAAFIAGLGVSGLIGYLDYSQLTNDYFHDVSDELQIIILAIVAVVFLGLLGLVFELKTRRLNVLLVEHRKRLAVIATVLVMSISLVIAFQPLWRTAYNNKIGKSITLIEARGISPSTHIINGKEVTRTFDELTPLWLVWYIGPVISILAIGGLGIATYRSIYKKEYYLLPVLLTVLGVSVIYLYEAKIFPDQIWASRRLLPIIMPGIIAFGVYAMSFLWSLPKSKLFGANPKVVVTVLSTVAVLSPLLVSLPFATLRESTPQLNKIQDVCQNTPERAAIFWIGHDAKTLSQATRTLCETTTEAYKPVEKGDPKFPNQAQFAELSAIATASGKRVVVAFHVINDDTSGLSEEQVAAMKLVHSADEQKMEQTILRPPHKTETYNLKVFLGELTSTGEIIELNAATQSE